MSEFSGATLMITGGTGSFGNTVLKHFLTSDIGEIRIFSRDEKKQDDMRHDLQARFPDYANSISEMCATRSQLKTLCGEWTMCSMQQR